MTENEKTYPTNESFHIDKKQFGGFLSELRKERGLTQKELAEKLFVSDKAVSKWECGQSMPDITLLKPLAGILEVTVAELLEGRRIELSENMNTERVDAILNKAIYFSEEEIMVQKAGRKKNGVAFLICTVLGCVEMLFVLAVGITWKQIVVQNILLWMILGVIFGIWFCFLAKERLPAYYDENRITVYSDGVFRMNLVGIGFNNRNWKHILQVGRIWSMVSLVVAPLLCQSVNFVLGDVAENVVLSMLILFLILGGLFIPMYVVARKYE